MAPKRKRSGAKAGAKATANDQPLAGTGGDGGAPRGKRARPALYYFNTPDAKERLKEANPGMGQKQANEELMSRWKNMNQAQRQPYQDRANDKDEGQRYGATDICLSCRLDGIACTYPADSQDPPCDQCSAWATEPARVDDESLKVEKCIILCNNCNRLLESPSSAQNGNIGTIKACSQNETALKNARNLAKALAEATEKPETAMPKSIGGTMPVGAESETVRRETSGRGSDEAAPAAEDNPVDRENTQDASSQPKDDAGEIHHETHGKSSTDSVERVARTLTGMRKAEIQRPQPRRGLCWTCFRELRDCTYSTSNPDRPCDGCMHLARQSGSPSVKCKEACANCSSFMKRVEDGEKTIESTSKTLNTRAKEEQRNCPDCKMHLSDAFVNDGVPDPPIQPGAAVPGDRVFSEGDTTSDATWENVCVLEEGAQSAACLWVSTDEDRKIQEVSSFYFLTQRLYRSKNQYGVTPCLEDL
ncbi:hypothetical protein LTR66_006870 [Elasticomyces elasticus]|nr:hypothetical protein LTR66_006870 [Elasticomyces elasticus]